MVEVQPVTRELLCSNYVAVARPDVLVARRSTPNIERVRPEH
jgi:hypothetical protein